METESKRKRRWFQFSLRTLMVVVTLLAVPLGCGGWQAKFVRERKAMLIWIEENGGAYRISTDPDDFHPSGDNIPWLRKALGDMPVRIIATEHYLPDQEFERIQEIFREAKVVRIMD